MKPAYLTLKKIVNKDGFGPPCHKSIENLFTAASQVLDQCERVPLKSKVVGKSYFAFEGQKGMSRPINEKIFNISPSETISIFSDLLKGYRHLYTSNQITTSIYTVAGSCCAAIDVGSKGDKKTPGTIFEWLCAAVMTASLKVSPIRSLPVLNLDLATKLPTDFIFDLGVEKPKFHLPVKTSTRERIIQVWAHQRVLDGVYGAGRFLAMPIVLTETKLNSKSCEVTEICLPMQWRLYQMHIASLWNVCYLDAPLSYLKLDDVFPRVGVSTIGDLLKPGGRLDDLLEQHGLTKN